MKIYSNGKMLEVSGSGGGAGEVYSTEEQVVGTWIDGKPLYRKVIVGNGPPSLNAWAVIGAPIANVDYVVKVDSYMANSTTGTFIPLPFIVAGYGTVSSLYERTGVDGRTAGLNVFSNYTGIVAVPIMAIIEYTKTTDQATIELPAALAAANDALLSATAPIMTSTAAISDMEEV